MSTLFDLKIRDLEGNALDLAALRGRVVLAVNTASACGYTPQYAGLEALHRELGPRGLSVLGFPSNDFGAQEPGTPAEVRSFCSTRYSVTFPLTEKIATTGPNAHPIYALFAAAHGAPRWNFHKYLVGRDGQVLAAFPSKVAPDAPELRRAIEAALAA